MIARVRRSFTRRKAWDHFKKEHCCVAAHKTPMTSVEENASFFKLFENSQVNVF